MRYKTEERADIDFLYSQLDFFVNLGSRHAFNTNIRRKANDIAGNLRKLIQRSEETYAITHN